jgi:hypothetical protein
MPIIYQPIVIEKTNEIINILEESDFFKENELESTEFAKKYFLNKLTEKFIIGDIDLENDPIFTDEEFEVCLREVFAGTILNELKDKGYVESYEDEVTEERFFLTEEGKEYLKQSKDLF